MVEKTCSEHALLMIQFIVNLKPCSLDTSVASLAKKNKNSYVKSHLKGVNGKWAVCKTLYFYSFHRHFRFFMKEKKFTEV